MKRMVLLAVLTLALPMAAFATSVDFTNSHGVLTGSAAGLQLTGSELIAVSGFGGGGLVTGNLGTLSFSTGALASGNLQNGGTFVGGTGSTFNIVSNGSGGIPKGALFTGSFSGPVTWTMVTLANGTHNYTLTGAISGIWSVGGQTLSGATVQLTINTGKGYFNGHTRISSGDTNVLTSSVPEPGTLGLLGTGLVGLAGVLHRKVKSIS